MNLWDWLKVVVLILLPINAWLGVHFYLNWQKQKVFRENLRAELKREAKTRRILLEWFGFKEGQSFPYPFPYPAWVLGNPPPVKRGFPVLFLNIATRADKEIWGPAIKEALNASPYLYVVLIHELRRGLPKSLSDPSKIQALLREFNHPRLSALIGEAWVRGVFGQGFIEGGILLVLCDGQGIIRAVESYPERKAFQTWEEEVEYWRTKFQQAVKNVLEKFFPKRAP